MDKNELIQAIRNHCLERGEVTLSSGQKSDFYINLKIGSLYGPCLFEIVNNLRTLIGDAEFDAIGGPSIGADPIVGAYLFMYADRGFLIRKQKKSYGKNGRVVGSVLSGDKCIVIEDVTTTGNSLLDAIKEIEKFGCCIVKAISIVDRSQGAKKLIESNGVPFESVLTIDEIIKD